MTDLDKATMIENRRARLAVFPRPQVQLIRERIGKVRRKPWPAVQGSLVVLFTARTGSTFLVRELEYAFDVGRMGESLNPAIVADQPVADIVRRREGRWFAFKAGLQGVVAGEFYGFFDAYMETTSFLQLVRRDIVAQAVSFAKATQTQQWHLEDQVSRTPTYDGPAIAKAVKKIVNGTDQLRMYAERTGRPCLTLIYEDFEAGDFASAFAACDRLGVPRRDSQTMVEHRAVERMSDDVNESWRARFSREMDCSMRDRIAHYVHSIEPLVQG